MVWHDQLWLSMLDMSSNYTRSNWCGICADDNMLLLEQNHVVVVLRHHSVIGDAKSPTRYKDSLENLPRHQKNYRS